MPEQKKIYMNVFFIASMKNSVLYELSECSCIVGFLNLLSLTERLCLPFSSLPSRWACQRSSVCLCSTSRRILSVYPVRLWVLPGGLSSTCCRFRHFTVSANRRLEPFHRVQLCQMHNTNVWVELKLGRTFPANVYFGFEAATLRSFVPWDAIDGADCLDRLAPVDTQYPFMSFGLFCYSHLEHH